MVGNTLVEHKIKANSFLPFALKPTLLHSAAAFM